MWPAWKQGKDEEIVQMQHYKEHQKDQVKKSNKYIKVRTEECKSVPSVPIVPPTEEREMTVKRKERTAECPVDSQGVSARREFTE